VDESGDVGKADVVKGYEYAKNKYVEIDPEELKALRLPTATTMQIKQFVKADSLPPSLFDRPYFVAPKEDSQNKALSIMRRALRETNTYGIGEIAFSGREHLVAIAAPLDSKQKGLMLYTLRFEEELREPNSALSGVTETSVASDELDLAKELIEKSTSRFDLSAYKDDYEAAVKKLVNAKRKGKSVPEEEAPEPAPKVINIMTSHWLNASHISADSQKKSGRLPRTTRDKPERLC